MAADLLPGDCLEEEIFSAVISRYKIFIFILLEIHSVFIVEINQIL